MNKRKVVFVVSTCNAWKEYHSFRLVGIFTSRRMLNPVLNSLLKRKEIEWDDNDCDIDIVNRFSDQWIQENLKYINIDFVTLNKVQ
jgi:hypothetical protein